MIGVAPARMASSRFPGKPLYPICGRPMVASFVLERRPLRAEPRPPTVCVDLPLAWTTALADRVNLLRTTQLEVRVPRA